MGLLFSCGLQERDILGTTLYLSLGFLVSMMALSREQMYFTWMQS